MEGFAEASVDGGVIRCESEGLAVWTAHSRSTEPGGKCWFDHWEGCVVVKNPDDETIGKMKRIAAHLQARVPGDEGSRTDVTFNAVAKPLAAAPLDPASV